MLLRAPPQIWIWINPPSSALLRNSPSFCIYLSITRLSSFRVILNTHQSSNRVVVVILRKEMLEGKAVVGETDMRQAMQQYALDLASKALDCFDVTDATEIARFIKKEFDTAYGIGWQCIVGTDFGSFVTHRYGCFIYFCIGSLAILLFKGSSDPVADEEAKQLLTLEPVQA